MNGLPYYKAYPRDFIEGTIGLSFEMKGAYRLVLDLIYMQGGNLPDDPRYIAGLLSLSLRKWKDIRQQLIDADKLVVNGEFLTNYRAVNELETLAKYQDKQSENRSRPNKNKGLKSPRSNHTEPDTEPERKVEPNGSTKKRGTRLPDDWQPDELFAKAEGLTAVDASREADKFRDYWRGQPGQRGIKLDWHATWKNWVRKVADDRGVTPARSDWRKQPEYRNVI